MRKEVLKSNPVDQVVKPRMKKRLPAFIEEEALNSFLDGVEINDDFGVLRDLLILELLFQTGMRRSELIQLRLRSFDSGKNQLKVLGKRNKERIIPLKQELANLIDRYISVRNAHFQNQAKDYLLLTDKGKELYPEYVYRLVTSTMSRLTLQERRSPHILRHSFATGLLNNGADLNAIKELLGHSNLAATQVYTHNSFEKLKSIYHKAHPRAD
jgi:integrase/recombinase XerC